MGNCSDYNSKVPKNNPRLLHSTDWTGIAQIQITHGIYCTQDNTDSKGPRNSNSNQIHNMSLCTSRHFSSCTDRRTVCATVHHSFISAAEFYIYVALSTYLPFYAQQQEVQKKCNIHRPTPFIHRFILINCLDSPMPCCLCLYLILKFKLYIKLNQLFKSPLI